jgi:hypothetical protein
MDNDYSDPREILEDMWADFRRSSTRQKIATIIVVLVLSGICLYAANRPNPQPRHCTSEEVMEDPCACGIQAECPGSDDFGWP